MLKDLILIYTASCVYSSDPLEVEDPQVGSMMEMLGTISSLLRTEQFLVERKTVERKALPHETPTITE